MRTLDVMRALRDRLPGGKPIHRAAREPYYRVLETLCPRGIAVSLSSGDRVRLHPRLLGMRPEAYEREFTAELIRRVEPGMVVLDVGAHVGLHTLMLSRRVGAAGRVFAIEPSPANAKLLREHLEWNGCSNVEVIAAAAGDVEREVQFNFRSAPTDPGSFANSLAYEIGGSTTTIPMTTIDRVCRGIVPHLIKIDIEGAENLALRGAKQTLSHSNPCLLVAIHPEPMRLLGDSPSGLVRFLEEYGYIGHHLDGRRATDPGFEEILFIKQSAISEAANA